jgi:cold shock CspA family protein
MKGRVRNINEGKQFGFIRGENGIDYFFHSSGLVNKTDWPELYNGREVTFEPTEGTKGPRAEDVMPF